MAGSVTVKGTEVRALTRASKTAGVFGTEVRALTRATKSVGVYGTEARALTRQVESTPVTTYVGAGATVSTTSQTTITPPLPAGLQAGDLMVATVNCGEAITFTPPAGWTELHVQSSGGRWWYRVYVDADPDPGFTSASASAFAIVCAFRGVNTSSPVSGKVSYYGTADPLVSPAITPTENAMIAVFHTSVYDVVSDLWGYMATSRFNVGSALVDGIALCTYGGRIGLVGPRITRDVHNSAPSETSIAFQINPPAIQTLATNRMKVRSQASTRSSRW